MSYPLDRRLYEKVKQQVKSRVSVWPSAYASGQVVREYVTSLLITKSVLTRPSALGTNVKVVVMHQHLPQGLVHQANPQNLQKGHILEICRDGT